MIEHGMAVRQLGAGREIVWIHGLGDRSTTFDPIARRLEGVTHVLPDLPGYGDSAPLAALHEHAEDSIEATVDHLASWLEERARSAGRSDPPILIGHSLGGALVTLLAKRARVGGVINVDGNLSRGDCTFSAEAAAYERAEFVDRGFAAMRARVALRGATEPALRGYHDALSVADPDVFHRHAIDLVRWSAGETLAGTLAALDVPVLFIAGVPGGICERSRTLLDQHQIPWIGLDPAGHWPFVDQPQLFLAAVRAFISAPG